MYIGLMQQIKFNFLPQNINSRLKSHHTSIGILYSLSFPFEFKSKETSENIRKNRLILKAFRSFREKLALWSNDFTKIDVFNFQNQNLAAQTLWPRHAQRHEISTQIRNTSQSAADDRTSRLSNMVCRVHPPRTGLMMPRKRDPSHEEDTAESERRGGGHWPAITFQFYFF